MSHLQENQRLPTDVNMEIDIIVGDYCVEFNDECQYIIEDVENCAKENGGYWEWIDSGSIVFVK